MPEFLPDYSVMPWNGKYRPLYRLFADARWRMVYDGKNPVECDTATDAIAAAKDRVKKILNSHIRVDHAEEPPVDVLGVEDWRKSKEAAIEEERSRVFVGMESSTIFLKGGRQVAVERKRRRA